MALKPGTTGLDGRAGNDPARARIDLGQFRPGKRQATRSSVVNFLRQRTAQDNGISTLILNHGCAMFASQ
jgi:hypothetical protein